MNGRFAIVSAVLALGGCTGLAVKPMPERLAAEEQQAYDYGWQHLTTMQSEVDRTALLDTILVGKLWHQGVDRLQLRSEKQVGDVLVVMETDFDRADPEGDVFVVSFYDTQQRVLRQEAFAAGELDAAVALYMTLEGEIEGEREAERQEREARLVERDERWARVRQVFPRPPVPGDGLAPALPRYGAE
jgi:hypothetical protein